MDRVRDANRGWLAIDLRGEELHFAGGRRGGLVETVSGRGGDGHRVHVTVRGNIDGEGDVSRDAAVERARWVNGFDALLDRRGLGQLGPRPWLGPIRRRRQGL